MDPVPDIRPKGRTFSQGHFNLQHLLLLAERLRGRPCFCDGSRYPITGHFNYAIFIKFDDGVEWVFRAPRDASAISRTTTCRLYASEAATLKYVKEHTSIPVPEVYHYSSTFENDIGVPYILMSKAAGQCLAYRWQRDEDVVPIDGKYTTPRWDLTDGDRCKVMRQIGRFSRQLFDLRLPSIGSLFENENGYHIGACLSPGHVLHNRDEIEIPRGPFDSEAKFYRSLAKALHLHAQHLDMGFKLLRAPYPVMRDYPSYTMYSSAIDCWNEYGMLGDYAHSSRNRLQYCLASQLLKDTIIPSIVRHGRDSLPGFSLCHFNLRPRKMFVDIDLNITCMINWAFTSTVPPAQLLAIPSLPTPREYVFDVSLANAFRSGFEIGDGQTAKRNLKPNLWKAGQMISRFTPLVNQVAEQDYVHLEALWTLIRDSKASGDKEDSRPSLIATLTERAKDPDALALAGVLAEDDWPESKIREEANNYFGMYGRSKKLALAQKVALADAMNPQFVADYRLWRWIDAVLKDRGLADMRSY